MENLDTFLDELERLDSNFFDVMASTSISTPNNIEKSKKIDVIATSSLAPDQIQAINSTATSNSSSFLFPVFQSPYASEEAAKNIFDQVLDPKTLLGFLYEDLEEREEASYLLHKCPYQSRTLAQFPMSKPRIEILPSRETMILDPCNLKYYFSPIEEQKTGIIYDAGFSSALNRKTVTRMDEYARGKIGNTPFAPGGETLVQLEQEKQEVKKAVEDPLAIFQLEHEQKRNALVLDTQKPFDLNDLVALHELEIQAPGLNDHLKVEDFLVATEKKEEIESTEEEQQQEEEKIGFGSNPKDLLKPYMDVMGDQNNVEAIKRLVKDEKEAHALQATAATKSITTEGTLTIEDLIAGLDDEDEDELFGNIEEQEEQEASLQQTEDTSLMATCTSSTTSLQTSTLPSAIATAKENTELEPEEELEAMLSGAEKLLSSDTSSLSAPKATTTSTNTTEWASTKSIDVRNFHQLVPEMAMEYTFELDTFQKEAIVHLENHECVFIAAHTSAGKTVVAEYAIGMSQKHMTRTIYTSPIKALSNQKYRDFREKYGPDQVGIITGDVSINPEASCLVMTTEILRSMLYRGADVIRDIEWVIFDEIHYINDSERGVVWEEVIIMLPDHIGMVFLSATTPNTFEFSDWIGRTKKKKIHVISTLKRPVPLEHFLYVKKDFIKLMDKNGQFLTGAYGQAMQKLYPTTKGAAAGAGGGRFTGGKFLSNRMTSAAGDQSDWFKFVHTLQEKNLLPVVVFAFSKRLCEESASKLKKMDLTNGPSEKAEIHLFLEQSVQRLQGSDRELPQVLNMKEMLKRGIGVHHGGLLPILKEMVEILFAKGLVKVLFATETFAMGVNMPARTVVFNGGVRKHDGKVFRDLSAGEYTQMAGRAGRRGLDSVGTVIIACWQDVPPEATTLQKMLVGKATLLTSQFRLTYNMILNLLRVEDMTVEDMMKRSFSEFRTQKMLSSKQIPKQIKKCQHLMKNVQNLLKEEYPLVQELGQLDILDQLVQTHLCLLKSQKKMVHTILHSKFGSIAVTPGRLVGVSIKGFVDRSTTHSPLIAVILRTTSKQSSSGNTLLGGDMIDHSSGTFKSLTVLFLCPEDYEPPCLTMKEEEKDNRKTTTNRSSDHLTGLNQLNKKKNSAMDFFMPKGNANKKDKRFGSINKEEPPKEEKLVSGMSGHLLGHKYAVLDISESCLDILMATSMEINMRSVLNNVKSEVSKAIQMLIDIKEEVDTFKRQQCALVTFSTRFLNPMQDLKINDLEIAQMYDEVHSNELNLQQVSTLLMSTSQSNNVMVFMGALLDKIYKIYALRTLIGRFQSALSNHALLLFPDFQQRLSVLTKLGYLSEEDNIVQLKGRVACEVNTCDELLLTEMIFENVLAHLEPEEIVSVLSALIFQEKTQSEPKLTPRLEYAKDQVKLIAESLGLIQLEQHLDIDPAVYCKNALNFGLMEVVYEWARGMPFKTLCDLTDIPEGSIVRCITRLDEVCREVRNAAKIIGDPRLYRKMEVASESIKRDVVFASSLYLA